MGVKINSALDYNKIDKSLVELLNHFSSVGFKVIGSVYSLPCLNYFYIQFALDDFCMKHLQNLVVPEITKVVIDYDSDRKVKCAYLSFINGSGLSDIAVDSYKTLDIFKDYYMKSDITKLLSLYRSLEAYNDAYSWNIDFNENYFRDYKEIVEKAYTKYLESNTEGIGILSALFKKYINEFNTSLVENKTIVEVPKFDEYYENKYSNLYLDLDRLNKHINEESQFDFPTNTNILVKLIEAGI